jgi:hypothetical protein
VCGVRLGGGEEIGANNIRYVGPDVPAHAGHHGHQYQPDAATACEAAEASGETRQDHHPCGLPGGPWVSLDLIVQRRLQGGGA